MSESEQMSVREARLWLYRHADHLDDTPYGAGSGGRDCRKIAALLDQLTARIAELEAQNAERVIPEGELEAHCQYLGWDAINKQWASPYYWGGKIWGDKWNTWRWVYGEHFTAYRKLTPPTKENQ